jgi:P-type conjugative transfer protein TrbJ
LTKTLRRLLAGTATALAIAAATAPAHAQYEVYDPWTFQEQTITYTQAVQQVANGVSQLQQLQSQLQAQQSMLQNLGTDNTSGTLAQVNSQAQQILQQAQGIGYNSGTAGQAFASQYPPTTSVAGFNSGQLNAALSVWQNNNSAALQSAVNMQAQVASNQQATASAVQNAVNASNNAPGQTAAIQATNQLLAAVAAQLAQLQAILLTQSQAQATLAAQQQSDGATAQSLITTTQTEVQTTITPPPGVTDTTHM